MHLDANNNATIFDELGKENTIIRFLVQRFMEEDDPADTAVDTLVGREEQLTVATPVLLGVLNPNGVEALRHAACRSHTHKDVKARTVILPYLKRT